MRTRAARERTDVAGREVEAQSLWCVLEQADGQHMLVVA